MDKPKITPPFYLFSCFVFEIIIYYALPAFQIIHYPYNLIGIIVLLIGVVLNIWTWRLFAKYRTTHLFEESSALVTEGPLKYTRNPMYLGLVLFLTGVAIISGNIISLFAPIIFAIIINSMFLPYEEDKMLISFGEEYIKYKHKVRRWM